jgi:hypothetical protein
MPFAKKSNRPLHIDYLPTELLQLTSAHKNWSSLRTAGEKELPQQKIIKNRLPCLDLF